jgi:hypothetical protein
MSNRRKIEPAGDASPVSDVIAALDGAQIPGGCDLCDAYQVVQARAFGNRNIHMVKVHHDDWCPVLAAHQAGGTTA